MMSYYDVRAMLLVTMVLLFVAAAATSPTTPTVEFVNRCSHPVSIYDGSTICVLPAPTWPDATYGCEREITKGSAYYRHGYNPEATSKYRVSHADKKRANGSLTACVFKAARFWYINGRVWYAIQIVPPGINSTCASYASCKKMAGKRGYNVAMEISPSMRRGNQGSKCPKLTCTSDSCGDAKAYPGDVGKLRSCSKASTYSTVFCP